VLRGALEDERQIRRIGHVARRIAGVREVENLCTRQRNRLHLATRTETDARRIPRHRLLALRLARPVRPDGASAMGIRPWGSGAT
jgi:hypothetical protein